ncbi:MAG TPA: dihydroxyacetone kinase subunit DhaK [Nitrososphaerales archaeon]|nr:dihydroxyacetone kinase subunit DhaK [Nitrososphaerales archaeon]
MTKRLMNDSGRMVDEELEGLVSLHRNSLRRLPRTNIIVRKDSPRIGKVSVIGGGGSGHEPMQAGFVGRGMLDAAIAGEIFAAPSPNQIHLAIREVDGREGTLLVVNNFAGDIMNFGLAEEMAEKDGIRVERVVVNDDIAVSARENRRGIAGGILVEKIAGAKAELGGNLTEVRQLAQRAVDNTRSMGVALTSCTLPSLGKPMFTLGDDEMEVGVGVHGERGVQRAKLGTADEVAELLVDRISADLELKRGDRIALLVNGLGNTSLMELLILSRKTVWLLDEMGVAVSMSSAGSLVTSLDMSGASLTLMRLDDELGQMLAAPDATPSFQRLF